jgi:hypothetical protein
LGTGYVEVDFGVFGDHLLSYSSSHTICLPSLTLFFGASGLFIRLPFWNWAGVKVFFGLLLITGCWPIVWASFDQVGSFIYQMDISWMGYALSEILINFMKAFGPLGLAIAAFSSEVGGTIKKGFGAVAMVSTPTAKVGAFVGSGAAAVSYVGVSKAKEKITRLRTQKTNRNGWKVGSE